MSESKPGSFAARIDGCSRLRTFRRIILPLGKPVITVMAVFTFQDVWNDFSGPLIYLNDPAKFTIDIALNYSRQSWFAAGVRTTNLGDGGRAAFDYSDVVPLLRGPGVPDRRHRDRWPEGIGQPAI